MQKNNLIQKIIDQLADNGRLRAGIGIIFLILMYVAFDTIDRKIEAEHSNYEELATYVESLKQLENQQEWKKLAKQVQDERRKSEARFIVAETEGLAQANVQSLLDDILAKLHITDLHMKVNSAQKYGKIAGCWFVPVRFFGELSKRNGVLLLSELEDNRNLTVIDKVEFGDNKRNKFILEIRIFCFIDK